MEKETKKNWLKEHKMSVFVVVSAVVMLIGLSYAWLQITLRGNKELTLIAAGTLYLELDDSMAGGISMDSAVPVTDAEGTSQEGYTFTLENKGKIASEYTIYLDDLDLAEGQTRMTDSVIKYQLTKDGREIDLQLLSGTGVNPERVLDSGYIDAGKKYTYNLKMWIDADATNEIMGTVFKGQLRIEAMQTIETATKTILANNPVQKTKVGMFNYDSSGRYYDYDTSSIVEDSNYVTNGLYSAEDDDGTSYYFRGNVTNNIVKFGKYEKDYYVYVTSESQSALQGYANEETLTVIGYTGEIVPKVRDTKGTDLYWRIVRINGDGTIRLVYAGTDINNISNISSQDNYYGLGYSSYYQGKGDSTYTDINYAGYTYDNGKDSLAKKTVDEWYQNYLGNTKYDDKVALGNFCSDSSGSEIITDKIKSVLPIKTRITDGFVFSSVARLVQHRLDATKNNAPTLKCLPTDKTYGGKYQLKAALLTADEFMFTGGESTSNRANYLADKSPYWTMTPTFFSSINEKNNPGFWYQYSNSIRVMDPLNDGYDMVPVLRPVINLKADTKFVAGGDGTSSNPYVVDMN